MISWGVRWLNRRSKILNNHWIGNCWMAMLGSGTLDCCFSRFLSMLHLPLYKSWEGTMSLVHDKFCIFGYVLRIFCNWILLEISSYISLFLNCLLLQVELSKNYLYLIKRQYPFNSVLYDQKTRYMSSYWFCWA